MVAAQGFLKVSCTVIGPNDPLPLRDPEQDAKDEADREKVRRNISNYNMFIRRFNVKMPSLLSF